ncbi:MAG: CotH kinase family protein [Lachnospiraceae bacterium]|nr:CotH kinase family protein [Lachnospiraceae bacterium]
MIDNKHISKIIIALMAVVVCICVLAVGFSDRLTEVLGGTGISMEYETELFDTDEIITVNILMDEDEWSEMLSNAMSEEYYVCDVEVNGETFYNVGIRPKGNTSLSSIAMDPDTDRYSLKLEFDQFEESQTCFGLDKLILNNNYADATNMKEAIIYDMYQYLGVDASLYNYATVSVNGEYWGVYLALEAVEDSFLLRNYGTQNGELYKPESMGIGGGDDDKKSSMPGNMPTPGNMPDFSSGDSDPENMPDFNSEDFTPGDMPADFNPGEMQGGPGGGGPSGMGGGGANLNYTDDELDSYSTIWEGAITDTTDADNRRVVTALKNISEGTDIETYMDIDNILKYMAVHTFAVNDDSLSGTMAHNYYIYENDGMLNIIPWDYNLSWGGMGMGGSSATDVVNDAIDTPFNSTTFFDALLENEEYLAKYHEYLQMLVDEYVDGGRFEETYNRIRSQIDELVATDPTAFYNAEEYDAAADTLYEVVTLRAESIKGQLDGTIPSTDDGQKEDSSSLINADGIDVSVMGQMNMGDGGDGDRVGVKENKRNKKVQ